MEECEQAINDRLENWIEHKPDINTPEDEQQITFKDENGEEYTGTYKKPTTKGDKNFNKRKQIIWG